ncbi:pyrimidine dimer DNA glycosylase/endonuclease V [Nocardioides jiangxiensis]|uniref:Pyrimidine dimer DNA glycosylase/endonuclease V n=1 Tax=Nocardioides jiangxiensis TaxID=3064524 RepID=A0ABT9B1D0_9ACTN|nr:pyrimidine dimer DNA glycosylase/endonuclease V [Nocardioides sp. WY-20]MDO7868048.1 pyrimidine dimer DNA glycosylase/endonuclease V [Nocardioides sp. WY-20]
MQTFLPYPSFAESAASLDRQRLGKQRVENLQILQVLTGFRLVTSERPPGSPRAVPLPREQWHLVPRKVGGWSFHPAVLMWTGHLPALGAYQEAICAEWTARGYRDTCAEKTAVLLEATGHAQGDAELPAWFGSERFHAAHRGTLLAKDPDWYGRYGWTDEPDPDGLWPVTREG